MNLVSSAKVSLAVSYSMGQSAPMVAAMWGLFVFGEFEGAPLSSFILMAFMFLFYFGAIACIAMSSN